MINPKEKAALQEMWGHAETASTDIPDGTYQFVIVGARFHMSDKGRPQFKTKLKVKGGAEEYVGKEFEVNDNLETPENMGWFKKKLTRLNIVTPEDFDEITDGTLAEQMVGKVFEGQAKTKNDFLNVYVNRLIGETHVTKEPEAGRGEESEDAPEDTAELEEGQAVTWNGKTGEILEITDDGKYRVKAEDGKVYRVAKELLKAVEEQAEDSGEADGEGEDGSLAIPSAEEVESIPAAEVKKLLKDLGLDAAKVKTPRAVLHGIVTLIEDPAAKIALTEIAPMADALRVTIKKGTPPKDAVKALSKAVQALVN